jgi:hypothetical protein
MIQVTARLPVKVSFGFMVAFLAFLPATSSALTKYDLMGDYVLVRAQNTYPSAGITLTERDITNLYGRASISGQAVTYEMGGVYERVSYARWGTGFYSLSGNRATVSIRGAGVDLVYLDMPNPDTLIATGYDYDVYGDYYTYRYEFQRTNTYYETAQVQQRIDSAVADATSDLYTRQQLDAAVNAATNSLYTQQELDHAVSAATADLFTRAELDAAAEAAARKVKVVPIFVLE